MSLAKLKLLPLIAVLALSVPLSGCSIFLMAATAPVIAHGEMERWKKKTLAEIEREASGLPHPKECSHWKTEQRNGMNILTSQGYKCASWVGYWKNDIEHSMSDGYISRRDTHIAFIITERRARGLPELK